MAKVDRRTALQRHVAFFDRDNDGIITIMDTYIGCRRLTYNPILSFILAITIHAGLSYVTRLGFTWLPDPFFRLYVKYMHKGIHGSHTGVYDTTGEFDGHTFDKILDRYSSGKRDGQRYLTGTGLLNMLKGQRLAFDPVGWIAVAGEWGLIWLICFDSTIHGIWEEDMRGQYDGSAFWKIEDMAKRGEWKRGYGIIDFINDLVCKFR